MLDTIRGCSFFGVPIIAHINMDGVAFGALIMISLGVAWKE